MIARWLSLLTRLTLLIILVAGASSASALQATPGASSAGITLAASGLTQPRGFTWAPDGTLYVAQASLSQHHVATPETATGQLTGGLEGSVARIDGGCPVVYQGNLPSAGGTGGPDLGPSALAFIDGQLYVVDEGGGASHGNPLTPEGIYRIDGGGSARLIADIGSWIRANPVAELPEDLDPDGDLTSMIAHGGALLVVESNSGQLLRVTTDGEITRVVDLSQGDSRPMGVAASPDGRIYVGLAAPMAREDASKVVAIGADGTIEDAWTGLTAVSDIAVGPNGNLHALQMGTGTGDGPWSFAPDSGSVVRQTGPDSSATVANGFDTPIAMAFGPGGGLYVSSPAIDADPLAGSVVRLDTAQGQVMTMSDSVLADSPCLPKPTPMPNPTDTAGSATPDSGGDTGGGVSVEIANFAFGPDAVTVTAGTTVTWTNNDTSAHTVTATDGSFDSGNIAPGETFSFTFDGEGAFDYICSYHPNMTASVTVTDAADTSGDSDAGTDDATPPETDTPESDEGGQAETVSIENFAFGPDTLTIPAGTAVTWTNNDTAAHTATAGDKTFNSGNLAPGDSFSFTFDKPGTYTYACMYHPNMTATIVVT